jgi:hypothetical protein
MSSTETAKKQLRVDFASLLIEALEQKVEHRSIYGGFANSELASI